MPHRRHRRRDERGQTTLFIVGFAVFLAMVVAVVVDVSAAYLQRQGLVTLADGAALSAAEGGAEGESVYDGGLGRQARLGLDQATATAVATDYLRRAGAWQEYPGLTAAVSLRGDRVVVRLRAPLDLPLTVPGAPATAKIGGTGSAVVQVLDQTGR
ncbi:pilus assembly protein TadG-related protein [Nocardioides sp.]|uniref:pilus assembly protein TadG-related protein n=1 Tax=Nocardioides sp. TaxID=35761 RepID=UPI002736117B|nr:pilus assembly protein TadG-related protein [Nocardioides sp.]MDP3890753.1 pilus assembly protein TadG-related protein [Nocardioides sp.]